MKQKIDCRSTPCHFKQSVQSENDGAGKPYLRGRLSTLDLLVLTSSYQVNFMLRILFKFFIKQATLLRRSTVLSLPPQLVFPGLSNFCQDVHTYNLWPVL
jgi:hypothetical protein